MKIVSLGQLTAFLDEELGWRRRELTTLKLLIQATRRPHERSALLRGAVCILYSHWERFVKAGATGYLNFVSFQGLTLAELTNEFVALCVRSRLRAVEAANRLAVHREVTGLLLSDLKIRADVPWEDAINGGNLNSELFREIISIVGLDYRFFATKEKLIDYRLLAMRNQIAHGYHIEPEVSEYIELHDQLLPLLQVYRNELENSAGLGRYRKR